MARAASSTPIGLTADGWTADDPGIGAPGSDHGFGCLRPPPLRQETGPAAVLAVAPPFRVAHGLRVDLLERRGDGRARVARFLLRLPAAPAVDRDHLGAESVLLVRKDEADVRGAAEVTFETVRAFFGQLLERRSHFDIATGAFDGHGTS